MINVTCFLWLEADRGPNGGRASLPSYYSESYYPENTVIKCYTCYKGFVTVSLGCGLANCHYNCSCEALSSSVSALTTTRREIL